MKLNPVFKKELRMFERTVKTSWIIFAYNAVLAAAALVILYGMLYSARFSGAVEYDNIMQIYIIMTYIQFGMLILIVPGLTASSISGERERQTLEILLSTQLTPWQIILGKLESSLGMVFMLAISSMPIVSLVFIFGGIKITYLLGLILLLVVEGVFIGSVGIFFSAVLKKTTSATVLTYTALLFAFIGTFLAVEGIYTLYNINIQNQNNAGLLMEQAAAADIKGFVYILLINPAVTFSGLISSQAGNAKSILNLCSRYGSYDGNIIVSGWFYISITIQGLLAVVLLYISSVKINPLGRGKGR